MERWIEMNINLGIGLSQNAQQSQLMSAKFPFQVTIAAISNTISEFAINFVSSYENSDKIIQFF